MPCEEVSELAPELALGLLDGGDRARMLSHLEDCESCRHLVDELATTIGRLVAAAPGIDPPPGFERQVLATVTPAPEHKPVRRRRLLALVGAVAAVAAVSVAAFVLAVGGDNGPVTRRATITAAGDWVHGDVLVVDAHPTWVTMRMSLDYEADNLHCELALADGRVVRLGAFHEVSGALEWGGTIQASAADVVEARVVDADGKVVAAGRLD